MPQTFLENEAQQQAADLNVTFDPYGQRDESDRQQVRPPIEVNQQLGQLGHARFVGSKTANSGGVAYAIQRAARCGLELQTSAQLKRLIAVLIERF
jgi:hypothetical protein